MPEPAARDEDLMAATLRGEPGAFAQIVARHTTTLFGVFRRLGADSHAAEDCVQETFLRLLKSCARYRPIAPFRAYLMVLARNTYLDARRRHRDALPLESGMPDEPQVPRKRALPGGFEALDLHGALDKLPEAQRLVLLLSRWHGLRYREIAELLDVPVGTVKSRVYTAVQNLKEALSRDVVS